MSTVRQARPVSTGSIPYAHEDFLHIDPFEKEHHIYIPLEWKYKKYPHRPPDRRHWLRQDNRIETDHSGLHKY